MGGSSSNDSVGGSSPAGSGQSTTGNSSSNSDKGESFSNAMSNAERPDRAPAASPDKPDTKATNDRPQSPNDGGNEPERAAGPPGIGAPPSSTAQANTENSPTDPSQNGGQEHERGFFGGLAKSMQDFAKENPRVDSHGSPVGADRCRWCSAR